MSSTSQQNGFHAKRAKLYNSKVTVVLGKCYRPSIVRIWCCATTVENS